MKTCGWLITLILSVSLSSNSVAQNQADPDLLSGVVGFTDVIVSDVPGYVAALKANPGIFSMLGSGIAGFCQAIVGGVPGEAQVFSFYPSMEAGLAAVETQSTSAEFQAFAATLGNFRELAGARIARVIRPYDGELYETWATRGLYVRSDNPDAYIASAAALEQAAAANGFADLSIDIYQEMGSGDRSDLLYAVVVSSSLARLGAAIDAIYSEPWAQSAFANVTAARSQVVDDRFYRCERVYMEM